MKPLYAVLGVAVVAVLIFLAMNGGQFTVTGNDCPDVPLTNDNGNPLTSYQQFRDASGNQQFTDEQLAEGGLVMKDGILVQEGQCPEALTQ